MTRQPAKPAARRLPKDELDQLESRDLRAMMFDIAHVLGQRHDTKANYPVPDSPAPGDVYLHYKGGLYLVLARAVPGMLRELREGVKLAVFSNGLGVGICALEDFGKTMHEYFFLLFKADYTGEPIEATRAGDLVVYVGLYDNPKGNRVCVRPLAEWNHPVTVKPPPRWDASAPVLRYRRVVGS